MSTGKLRWGVLGTARIADAHVEALKLSNSSELAAIASRDMVRAREWAGKRGVPHIFGSYEEMLESSLIDAVYVPLPNSLHKEWSIKAMQHSKHVLCEKPLAADAQEVEEMIAVAKASGVKLMEAFMYRFHPQIERMQQLLADQIVGKPSILRATFGFSLQGSNDVRLSSELAGGSLMDVGCYCVNVAMLVAGAMPSVVTARESLTPGGVDDAFVGVLEFPGGLLAAIDCSFNAGENMQQSLSISGPHGRLLMSKPFRPDGSPPTIVIDRALDVDRGGPFQTIEVPNANPYHLMHESFAASVIHNRPTAYRLHDSLSAMRTIDALKQSARTGRAVELK